MCLVDSYTTNYVLRKTKCFQTGNILTIVGRDASIVGYEKTIITLPMVHK
jgi:hypothetical protein